MRWFQFWVNLFSLACDGPDLAHRGLVTHPSLIFDVEGLKIYKRDNDWFLIASSQGDSTFVIFGLPDLNQVLKFAVGPSIDRTVDGVSDTDGLAASGSTMPGFPMGLLVVQDGRNSGP
ncbi:MAG: hypothetical protein CMQ05_13185 [Gammaproteobacteria bacterium]|nr:hypothetical protein [Gammaproteobacteria bacterium]RPG25310.1 MAG: phytase [Gammaproteobacteria bacterium TMED50]|tara:strand:- start:18516 stop:18869 length:354 start_codon:yes stop_codon:yes gene_type:complete